jgi:hypothetical protein
MHGGWRHRRKMWGEACIQDGWRHASVEEA